MSRTAVEPGEVTGPDAGSGDGAEPGPGRGPMAVRRVLVFGAAATALALLCVFVINLVSLVVLRHPFVGYSDAILTDSEAVATGHLQYGNPATQFVGFPYSPLYVWLVAGLLRVFWWAGWGTLVSMAAALGSIFALVRPLWRTMRTLEQRIVAVSFVVAVSLGGLAALPVVSGAPLNGLDGRPDQLAWCLVVVAGTLLFGDLLAGRTPRLRRQVAIGALLAASVATKQTTVVPAVLLALLALLAPALIERSWRRPVRRWAGEGTVLATMAGLLVVLGLVLQVASHGFALDIMTTMQLRYSRIVLIGSELETSLRLLLVPLGALTVLVVCTVRSMRVRRELHDRRQRVVAVAAVVVALSPIPTAVLAAAKLGGGANQLIGPVWTSVLACTVLLLLLRPSVRLPAAAALGFAVLLCGIDPVAWAIPGRVGQPDLVETVSRYQQDPFLLQAVNRGEVVYDEQFPSLSVSPRNSSAPASDWNDAWAGGYTPRWFIDNLVSGRYALVSPVFDWGPGYTADFGAYDRSVPWKINLLLRTAFTEVKDPDSGQLLYRPSPKLAHMRWFAGCFGPYQARGAGVAVRQRGNGGLLCIAAGSLHLTLARLPQSQLVMTMVPGHGAVTLTFRHSIPRVLRVTPLDTADVAAGPASDIHQYGSAVGDCLVRGSSTSSITMKAAAGIHNVRCVMSGGRPVVEVPVSAASEEAHVSLLVGQADSPRIVATSARGSPAPFTLLDLTPGEINSL